MYVRYKSPYYIKHLSTNLAESSWKYHPTTRQHTLPLTQNSQTVASKAKKPVRRGDNTKVIFIVFNFKPYSRPRFTTHSNASILHYKNLM